MLDTLPPAMNHKLKLAETVTFGRDTGGATLDSPMHQLKIHDPTVADMFTRLDAWRSLKDLFEDCAKTQGPALAARLQKVLGECEALGMIDEGIALETPDPALSIHVQPGSGLAHHRPSGTIAPPYSLALHAQLQPDGGVWTLVSPLAWGWARITSADMLSLIGKMSAAWTPETAIETEVARLLVKCGLLVSATAQHDTPPLARHEAWLHMLSRRGTAGKPVGARAGKPRSIVPPQHDGQMTPLDRNDVQSLPYRQLISQRKSWRTCPVDAIETKDVSALLEVAIAGLPYPSAGDCYDIDVIVALRDVQPGLPRLARYDPGRHALIDIEGDPIRLLDDASTAMGRDGTPPGLLILSARFARMRQNYRDAAYAQMLKNSGVMLQTLHLGATALGIGSCIIGGGNSREFATLTGLGPMQEGPIGEMVLTGRFAPAIPESTDDR